MDLNEWTSDEDVAPALPAPPPAPPPPPPPPPPVQEPGAPTGATTDSMDADEAEGVVVEMEVVQEEACSQAEELDPRTLGVPGLKTLMPGDRVEVLWRHGASSLPMLALPAAPPLQPHRRRCRL